MDATERGLLERTAATAFASILLNQITLRALSEKGLVSAEKVREIVDAALTIFEQNEGFPDSTGLSVEARSLVRQLLTVPSPRSAHLRTVA